MAWKPKEKQLTPEEAVALARKELAPFWHGSEPLLAGVRTGQAVTAHPLVQGFAERPWLILLVDPTDFAGRAAAELAREWHRRYSSQEIGFLMVCRTPYEFLRGQGAAEELARALQVPFPLVADVEGLLCAAFHAARTPKVLLLHSGRIVFEREADAWIQDSELSLQNFLRKLDPGLPLPPVCAPPEGVARDAGRIEFGARFPVQGGYGAPFPAPGFAGAVNGFRVAQFRGSRPAALETGQFFITGNWLQDGERIATSDPQAAIGFKAPSTRVALIAQSLAKIPEPSRITVEIGDSPVYDAIAGEDLVMDEDGQSVVRVQAIRTYNVLRGLSAQDRQITLRFPSADRVSVTLYGFRFGEEFK